jgi:hypothetical protein
MPKADFLLLCQGATNSPFTFFYIFPTEAIAAIGKTKIGKTNGC